MALRKMTAVRVTLPPGRPADTAHLVRRIVGCNLPPSANFSVALDGDDLRLVLDHLPNAVDPEFVGTLISMALGTIGVELVAIPEFTESYLTDAACPSS